MATRREEQPPPVGTADGERYPQAQRGALGGLISLAVILSVLWVLLRALHLGVPLFYPEVLQGPFTLDSVAQAEEYAGFSPLTPFYRPAELGSAPVYVTVFRRPRPRVVIFWQGDRFLYLEQTEGGEKPPAPPHARPLTGRAEAVWWREGRTRHLVTRAGGLWVEIRTDLDERDLRRIVETLRPYRELL